MKKRREDRIKEQMERELERQREQRQADEIYMKEAIKQAKKAYAIQEVPIGCVIVHEGISLPVDTIGEPRIKIRWHMQRSRRFEKPVRSWRIGDWKNVPCM